MHTQKYSSNLEHVFKLAVLLQLMALMMTK